MNKKNDKKSCLGIIAGAGALPQALVTYCQKEKREFCIVGIEHQTDEMLLKQGPHLVVKLGQLKKAINFLKQYHAKELVLIGAVRRPSIFELKPDLKTLKLLFQYGFGQHGDDAVLRLVDQNLSEEGFELHGVHEYLPELLMSKGALGKVTLGSKYSKDLEKAKSVLYQLGQADVGQSTVVQNELILGVEAIEGTDELIKRCGAYQRKGPKAILVKMKKPSQDERFDLPTIGPKTIENLKEYGYAGIALQAGAALVVELDQVMKLANKYDLFVYGFEEKNEKES